MKRGKSALVTSQWGPWKFGGRGTDTGEVVFTNGLYTVIALQVWFKGGYVWHLSMRNRDRTPMIDWRDKQRIKSELCGSEAEGAELFPAESRLLDASNQFHMWVLPTGDRYPFGFDSGRGVVDMDDYRAMQAAGGTPQVPLAVLDRILTRSVQRDLGKFRTAGLGHDGLLYAENWEAQVWGIPAYKRRKAESEGQETANPEVP